MNSSPVSGSIFGWAANGLTGLRAPPKCERAAGLQRLRVELPGEPLLAEGQQRAAIRVDADVERRLQGDAAHQPVAREGGAEGAVERPAGGLLLGEPRAAHEAGGEVGARPSPKRRAQTMPSPSSQCR